MPLDIARFREERVYSTHDTVPAIMADLVRLSRFDEENLKLRKDWKDRSVLAFFSGGIILVSGLVFSSTRINLFPGLVITVGAGLVFASLVFLIVSWRFGAMDLDDQRYGLVSRLLQRLRKDIPSQEPVKLEVGFHANTLERYLVDTGMAGEWKTQNYVNPWLSFQARLADGTHLRLGMEHRLQKRERSRRNPRGKWKTKRKQKGEVAVIHVQLRVKPERHPGLAGLERRARAAVKLPPGVTLSRLTVTEDTLSLRARTVLYWDEEHAARTVLMMLLSLYQVLNYSTAVRKRGVLKASA